MVGGQCVCRGLLLQGHLIGELVVFFDGDVYQLEQPIVLLELPLPAELPGVGAELSLGGTPSLWLVAPLHEASAVVHCDISCAGIGQQV